MKTRFTIVAGLLSGAALMLAAAPAMARVDVALNVGVPGYYIEPAPVYVQPRPVYVERRPVYIQPQPYYIDQQYGQDWRVRRWERRHHRGQDGYERRYGPGYEHGYDADHDGIPNRYDRDRDGDSVPNRFDRRPNNPYRD